jgi:hypothetical protein
MVSLPVLVDLEDCCRDHPVYRSVGWGNHRVGINDRWNCSQFDYCGIDRWNSIDHLRFLVDDALDILDQSSIPIFPRKERTC